MMMDEKEKSEELTSRDEKCIKIRIIKNGKNPENIQNKIFYNITLYNNTCVYFL
jgi:hypothetical protein